MKHSNQLLASICEVISLMFIERRFFQNNTIPMTMLLNITNDLLRTLNDAQIEKLSLKKELIIVYKQLMGKPLTEAEYIYDSQYHEIDVMSEIANGIRYAAGFSLFKNLYNTLGVAAQQGLWRHIPSVLGYTGAALLGPSFLIQTIESTLSKTNLTQKQKDFIRPWLNTIGRMALGLMPKVSSNQHGITYQYASTEGHFLSYSQNVRIHQQGQQIYIGKFNNRTVEASQNVYSADGKFTFLKLDSIAQLSEHTVRVVVTNERGVKIPVTFGLKNIQKDSVPFSVNSTNKTLGQEWQKHSMNCFSQKKQNAITQSPQLQKSIVKSSQSCLSSFPEQAGNLITGLIAINGLLGNMKPSVGVAGLMLNHWFTLASADLTNGLVAYYPFNGNVNDESGNGNHGTVYDAQLATDRFGNRDSAYYFDGSNDYILVPNSTSLNTPTAITVAAWICDLQHNQGYSISRDAPGNRAWVIRRDSNTTVNWHIWNSADNLRQFVPTNSWAMNQWFHIVCTANVTSNNIDMKVFLDGELKGADSFPGDAIKMGNIDMVFGSFHPSYTGGYKNQFLDEIRIYNRALNSTEVAQLYRFRGNESSINEEVFSTNQILVNNYTSGEQQIYSRDGWGQHFAEISNNSFILMWGDGHGQDGDDEGIFAQIFNNTGDKISNNFQINSYFIEKQWGQRAARLLNDTFVVTWVSHLQDGSSSGIYARVFDAIGNNLTNEFRVNDYTDNNQIRSAVDSTSNGNFVIAWQGYGRHEDWDIYARVFNATGNASNTEFRVTLLDTYHHGYPSVFNLGNNNFRVRWIRQDRQTTLPIGRYYKDYNATSFPLTGELNAANLPPQTTPDGYHLTLRNNATSGELYGQIHNVLSNQTGSEFLINPIVNTTSYGKSSTENNSLVVWVNNHGSYGINLFGSLIDWTDRIIQSEFRIDQYPDPYMVGNQLRFQVNSLFSGQYAVSWQSFDGNNHGEIFVRMVDPSLVNLSSSSSSTKTTSNLSNFFSTTRITSRSTGKISIDSSQSTNSHFNVAATLTIVLGSICGSSLLTLPVIYFYRRRKVENRKNTPEENTVELDSDDSKQKRIMTKEANHRFFGKPSGNEYANIPGEYQRRARSEYANLPPGADSEQPIGGEYANIPKGRKGQLGSEYANIPTGDSEEDVDHMTGPELY